MPANRSRTSSRTRLTRSLITSPSRRHRSVSDHGGPLFFLRHSATSVSLGNRKHLRRTFHSRFFTALFVFHSPIENYPRERLRMLTEAGSREELKGLRLECPSDCNCLKMTNDQFTFAAKNNRSLRDSSRDSMAHFAFSEIGWRRCALIYFNLLLRTVIPSR